tara:strand:+ start:22742 stop:22972 length:231 start_codon:yes stop_codon:yes gene_type:complete
MSSRFSYTQFIKQIIDSAKEPVSPSSLDRQAIGEGAPHTGETLRRKLRESGESLANSKGYRRLRVKGVPGYQYEKS